MRMNPGAALGMGGKFIFIYSSEFASVRSIGC